MQMVDEREARAQRQREQDLRQQLEKERADMMTEMAEMRAKLEEQQREMEKEREAMLLEAAKREESHREQSKKLEQQKKEASRASTNASAASIANAKQAAMMEALATMGAKETFHRCVHADSRR